MLSRQDNEEPLSLEILKEEFTFKFEPIFAMLDMISKKIDSVKISQDFYARFIKFFIDKTYGVVSTSSLIGSDDNLNWILDRTLKRHRVESITPLYSSEKHGFSRDVFHKLVDGKGPQLTLMRSRAGKVFGGFTMKHWQSPWLVGYVEDPEAFLISLDLKKEYRVKNHKNAIFVGASYGPIFGNKDIEFKANLSNLNEENGCYCYTGHP